MTDRKKDIARLRKEYSLLQLSEETVLKNPIAQFEIWFKAATEVDPWYANAVVLSTADPGDCHPSSRMVLLKDFDEAGFVFYTNYLSQKGKQLAANPKACLLFFWKELERQVRIEGVIEKVSSEESDAYFQSRPRESQIGAWASAQSSEAESRLVMEQKFAELQNRFGEEGFIPRPENWGGYLLRPVFFEFWQGRLNRMHDRVCYRSEGKEDWKIFRLYP